MIPTRRWVLLAPLVVSALRGASAQEYPTGPIRVIAPGPAASPRDIRARWVAEQLTAALGRPVIVDNKPGAGGNIGMEAAAKSAPDGRTLVIVDSGTLAQNPHLYDRPGYKALTDFTPVIGLTEAGLLLAVPAASLVRKVSDLVALAKASPGKLVYGSAGIATPPHLAGGDGQAARNRSDRSDTRRSLARCSDLRGGGTAGCNLCRLDGLGRTSGNAETADRTIKPGTRACARNRVCKGVVPQPGRNGAGRSAFRVCNAHQGGPRAVGRSHSCHGHQSRVGRCR